MEQVAPVDGGDQQHHQQALHCLAEIFRAGDVIRLAGAEAKLMHQTVHEGRLHDHRLGADQMHQQHAEQQLAAVEVDCRGWIQKVFQHGRRIPGCSATMVLCPILWV